MVEMNLELVGTSKARTEFFSFEVSHMAYSTRSILAVYCSEQKTTEKSFLSPSICLVLCSVSIYPYPPSILQNFTLFLRPP